jgi:HSP20 family molecular chaperone IbpA
MAGWFYITSDIDPYPKIHIPHTYPEKGSHLRHISTIPYVAHNLISKFHDKDLDAHQPKTDVRETTKNFYLEVELPGVKEHTELRLRWTNSRTLLLTSKTTRPEIPDEELVEEPALPAAAEGAEVEAAQQNGETAAPAAAATEESKPKPKLLQPHLTIHERLVGEMIRAYSFPVDVDRDGTHAKLEAGILRVVVPKVVHEQPATVKEGEEEKHFIHVPVRIFSHGHEKKEQVEEGEKKEKKVEEDPKKKTEDAVPSTERRNYLEALGEKLF